MPDIDERFGQVALSKGFITSEQLRAALTLQQSVREQRGINRPIGEILIQQNLITASQVAEILKEQGKRVRNQIEGYEILEKIGQGGMAAVFKAVQHRVDRIVALKILLPSLMRKQENVQRFLQEALAAAKLSHPNIVRAIDAGNSRGFYYFAMEYIEGETLGEVLRREGPLDEDRALEITLYVAAALHHAHQNGVIHRDVKPDNIFLTTESTVKLGDLGIAKLLVDDATQTRDGWTVGSANYISPEQALGKPVDARTDIYSLGATLYHMLAGRPPFIGKTAVETMAMHYKEQPPPIKRFNPQLSAPLCAFIMKMMAKGPDKRFQNIVEVVSAINSLVEGTYSEIKLSPMRTGKRPSFPRRP